MFSRRLKFVFQTFHKILVWVQSFYFLRYLSLLWCFPLYSFSVPSPFSLKDTCDFLFVCLLFFLFSLWCLCILFIWKTFLKCLDKEMKTHSSTLAWKIPWTEEPGRLQSMGSLGVRHEWVTSLSLFTVMHWRRKWQPTPVLLPGESQGRGSLVGCHLWGHTELDRTEAT